MTPDQWTIIAVGIGLAGLALKGQHQTEKLKTKYLRKTSAERGKRDDNKNNPKTRIKTPDSLRQGASQAAGAAPTLRYGPTPGGGGDDGAQAGEAGGGALVMARQPWYADFSRPAY